MLKSGTATDTHLKEAWLVILNEYYVLKDENINGVEHWKLTKDILRLQNHLTLLQYAIDFLSERYSEPIAASLRKLGYVFHAQPFGTDMYRNALQVIVNKSKTKYIQLSQLTKQLEKTLKNIPAQPTRGYFDEVMIEIEAMQKISYNTEEISVAKYIQLEKKYFKYVESINKHGKH